MFRYILKSGLLARFFIAPFLDPIFILCLNMVAVAEILVFAVALSRIVNLPNYYTYLAPGVIMLSFYTTIYGLIEEIFFFATRVEVHLYTYTLPIPRYLLAAGFSLTSGILCAPLYTPYVMFIAMISHKDNIGTIFIIASLLLLMLIFSIVIGGLVATLYISIKSNWGLLLAIFVISDILQRFSTAYYPLNVFPEAYRAIAIVNPLTHFINIGQGIVGVDRSLLIDEVLSLSILASYSVGLLLISILMAERLSEGGRVI